MRAKSRPAVWRDAVRDSGDLSATTKHVAHELRFVAVAELQEWLARAAARTIEDNR